MIIELSHHFADFSAADWQPYHSAVENIIQAHGQGYHLFSPSRDVIASIERGCQLSLTQQQVLRFYIKERISILAGQVRSADTTILCLPNGVDLRSERANQISQPLGVFADLDACGPSRLITENAEVDGALLELVAETSGRQLGYGMPLRIEKVHGGGGTTGACYQAACKRARPCICIVDSDRKYLGDANGETARKVIECEGTQVHPTVCSIVLPVRELENAIPISALFEVYKDNPQVRSRVSPLIEYITHRRVTMTVDSSALDFVDLKLGLKRSDIARVPAAERQSLKQFAHVVSAAERALDHDDPSDETVVHAGVSMGMLAQVVSFLVQNGSERRAFVNRLMKSPAWVWMEDIVRRILSYGAAGERLPVRAT